MSKRYMDFVPAKGTKKGSNQSAKKMVDSRPKSEARPKPVSKPVISPKPKIVSPRPQVKRSVVQAKKPQVKDEVKLGVIEDLGVNEEQPIMELENKIHGERGGTYKVPKTPFINQEKVVKRPLSKNVYQKKVVAPKEVPKGPVTIISKPEKDAHVSLIVAVILTIILGAAAGTVAFLLLPK